jgi:hypothetical protein
VRVAKSVEGVTVVHADLRTIRRPRR